jgi:hypothetical protein
MTCAVAIKLNLFVLVRLGTLLVDFFSIFHHRFFSSSLLPLTSSSVLPSVFLLLSFLHQLVNQLSPVSRATAQHMCALIAEAAKPEFTAASKMSLPSFAIVCTCACLFFNFVGVGGLQELSICIRWIGLCAVVRRSFPCTLQFHRVFSRTPRRIPWLFYNHPSMKVNLSASLLHGCKHMG